MTTHEHGLWVLPLRSPENSASQLGVRCAAPLPNGSVFVAEITPSRQTFPPRIVDGLLQESLTEVPVGIPSSDSKPSTCLSCIFVPNHTVGPTVWAGWASGHIVVYSLEPTPAIIETMFVHRAAVNILCLSSAISAKNQFWVFANCLDGSVSAWDTTSRRTIFQIPASTTACGPARALCGNEFSLYVGFESGAVAVYTQLTKLAHSNAAPSTVPMTPLGSHRSVVRALLMSCDSEMGDVVWSSDELGKVMIHRLSGTKRQQQERGELALQDGPVVALCHQKCLLRGGTVPIQTVLAASQNGKVFALAIEGEVAKILFHFALPLHQFRGLRTLVSFGPTAIGFYALAINGHVDAVTLSPMLQIPESTEDMGIAQHQEESVPSPTQESCQNCAARIAAVERRYEQQLHACIAAARRTKLQCQRMETFCRTCRDERDETTAMCSELSRECKALASKLELHTKNQESTDARLVEMSTALRRSEDSLHISGEYRRQREVERQKLLQEKDSLQKTIDVLRLKVEAGDAEKAKWQNEVLLMKEDRDRAEGEMLRLQQDVETHKQAAADATAITEKFRRRAEAAEFELTHERQRKAADEEHQRRDRDSDRETSHRLAQQLATENALLNEQLIAKSKELFYAQQNVSVAVQKIKELKRGDVGFLSPTTASMDRSSSEEVSSQFQRQTEEIERLRGRLVEAEIELAALRERKQSDRWTVPHELSKQSATKTEHSTNVEELVATARRMVARHGDQKF